jgi:hypothetical protein
MKLDISKEWCMKMARQEELSGDPDCSAGSTRTVTLIVPDGYASGEEFAKDCGFEIAKPPPVRWDAFYNRHYEPVEKRAAEIYATFEYNGPGTKPDWLPHGNSTMQDKARELARDELQAPEHQRS